jgi:hypothetical protein
MLRISARHPVALFQFQIKIAIILSGIGIILVFFADNDMSGNGNVACLRPRSEKLSLQQGHVPSFAQRGLLCFILHRFKAFQRGSVGSFAHLFFEGFTRRTSSTACKQLMIHMKPIYSLCGIGKRFGQRRRGIYQNPSSSAMMTV